MAKDGKSRRWKWLVTLIVLAGALVGGAWYFGQDHTEAPEYQTATVTRGDLTQTGTMRWTCGSSEALRRSSVDCTAANLALADFSRYS